MNNSKIELIILIPQTSADTDEMTGTSIVEDFESELETLVDYLVQIAIDESIENNQIRLDVEGALCG